MSRLNNTGLTTLTDAELDHVGGGSHLVFDQMGKGVIFAQDLSQGDNQPEIVITPHGHTVSPGQDLSPGQPAPV